MHLVDGVQLTDNQVVKLQLTDNQVVKLQLTDNQVVKLQLTDNQVVKPVSGSALTDKEADRVPAVKCAALTDKSGSGVTD